jgi:hypothetical protein
MRKSSRSFACRVCAETLICMTSYVSCSPLNVLVRARVFLLAFCGRLRRINAQFGWKQNAADDEDKQRKALEAEAKKIKVDMQQLIADFHVRLAQLAEHRLAVERSILQAEFEVVLLLQVQCESTGM